MVPQLEDRRDRIGIFRLRLFQPGRRFLGTLLEPEIGKLRFAAIYFVSLLGGSFGALLVSPNAVTVGASAPASDTVYVLDMVVESETVAP